MRQIKYAKIKKQQLGLAADSNRSQPIKRQACPSSAPASGYAALRKYIAGELREARRALRIAGKDPVTYRSAIDYWQGQEAALVKLRDTFATPTKAPHTAPISCDTNDR